MKFTCDYTELLSALEKISTVVEDSNSNDDMKNVIFRFEKLDDGMNVCTLIGISSAIVYKHILEYDKYSLALETEELQDNVCFMQIKSKELLNFLNAYKTTRRTKVESVTFEFKASIQIRCSVLEHSNDEDNIPYVSTWLFSNLPIKPNLLPLINAKPMGRLLDIAKEDLMYHLSTLVPVLQNVNTLYGKLTFGADYVVAFHNAFVALMKNKLVSTHIFENMLLTYKVLTFLMKVVCNQDNIQVAKSDTQLYIRTAKSESFIMYDTKGTAYSQFLEMYGKEKGFCIDRLLLKDILKRLSLSSELVEVTLKPSMNILNLRNSKFTQDIPLMVQTGLDDVGDMSFKILPDVFSKAIIGSDSEFSSNTYMYFKTNDGNSTNLIFTDDTDTWFTVTRVKTSSSVR